MQELPKRSEKRGCVKKDIYDFTQIIRMMKEGTAIEEIQERIACNLYIENSDLLKDNFDLFTQILKNCRVYSVCSRDFDCLKYIEENSEDYSDKDLTLSLMDDFQNKDRSYMDLKQFKRFEIEIPLCYVLWNPSLQENQLVSLGHHEINLEAFNFNNWKRISLEGLKEINKIIEGIASQCSDLSDLEKVILISNYLQNNVQFVEDNNVSNTKEGVYYTDSKDMPVTNRDVSSPEVVLIRGYGLCAGIAAATTLLSNNPLINLNVRPIMGASHVWNIIEINGEHYYIDNTWNITRNHDRYPESLKAKSFSSEYLLFGEDTAESIGYHIPYIVHQAIAKDDFDGSQVLESTKKLTKSITFNNYSEPVFKSRFQKHEVEN